MSTGAEVLKSKTCDMSIHQSLLLKLRNGVFAPVDIASLVFFRIAFGLLMIWEVCRFFAYHWIAASWLEPQFLFKYYGFSWVHPWPGQWLYVHWMALGVFALFLAAGFVYRISAALFFLSYTYFFLLDEAWYVNHTYLICLFSFLLIFVPAHRAFSVDAWLRPRLRSDTTPAWTLWLLRAQMAVVYFYGGLAKISPDWLRGEPMRTRMAHNTDFSLFGRFFREEWAVYAVSYGGLLLDLSRCIKYQAVASLASAPRSAPTLRSRRPLSNERMLTSCPAASSRRARTVHWSGERWAKGSIAYQRTALRHDIWWISSSGTPSAAFASSSGASGQDESE